MFRTQQELDEFVRKIAVSQQGYRRVPYTAMQKRVWHWVIGVLAIVAGVWCWSMYPSAPNLPWRFF